MIGRLLSWGTAWRRVSIILGLFMAMAPASAFATTYYVDFVNGSDAKTGTNKSTAWAHAPGMTGCSGACNATTMGPGDSVIFKGGVIWDQTCFPFKLNFSGTPSSRILYSVDQTWFAGGTWTRPIFDGFFNIIPGGSMVVFGTSTQWVTFDNIEVRNLKINNAGGAGLDNSLIQFMYGAINITVQNCLVHSMQVTTTGLNSDQQFGAIYGLGPMTNTVVDHCTIFNDQDVLNSPTGLTFNIETVTNSILHDGIQGTFGSRIVHDNLIYNIRKGSDPNSHQNALEVQNSNAQVYNNIVHDVEFGTCFEIVAPAGGGSGTIQIYNNVIWNSAITPINLDPDNQTAGNININVFNNTINGQNGVAVRTVPRSLPWGTVTVKNNHYITDSIPGDDFAVGTYAVLVSSTNVLMTQARAASQGYTIANQFAPALPSGATVGVGLSLASVGIPNLNFDIKGVARPSIGWDAGAFQFGGTSRPAPSSGLVAVVQ